MERLAAAGAGAVKQTAAVEAASMRSSNRYWYLGLISCGSQPASRQFRSAGHDQPPGAGRHHTVAAACTVQRTDLDAVANQKADSFLVWNPSGAASISV